MRPKPIPFLTLKQEHSASAEALILAHEPLVCNMAARFARCYGLDVEDLRQEGRIGLVLAAGKFDRSKGWRFATYARWWVLNQMMEMAFRGKNIVRPGAGTKARAAYFRNRPPHDISLDAPMGLSGVSMADGLACPAPLPDALVEDVIDEGLRSSALRAALARLPDRDGEIIAGRYLSEPKLSLDELGARFSLSKERVRQLEVRALERLRNDGGLTELMEER